MMELLTRIVAAIESIADSFRKMANPLLSAGSPDTSELTALETVNATSTSVDYDALAAEGKRDALLLLCEQKGVIVPPRTKTATLPKLLKAHDDANAGNDTPEPEQAPDPAGAGEPDPFNTDAGAGEPDPFSGTGSNPAPEPVTREQVLSALQAVQQAKGNAEVINILKKAAGVEKLKDLPEDKFSAVLKEAA